MQFPDVRASHLFFIMVFGFRDRGVGVESDIKLASAYVHTIDFPSLLCDFIWLLSSEATSLIWFFANLCALSSVPLFSHLALRHDMILIYLSRIFTSLTGLCMVFVHFVDLCYDFGSSAFTGEMVQLGYCDMSGQFICLHFHFCQWIPSYASIPRGDNVIDVYLRFKPRWAFRGSPLVYT